MTEEKISEDDDSWVFDSLVNFLHGGIWKLPVLGFIEEKSVVFDPDSYNNMTDEKEEEYRKIHEEYKALVDYMLANFMEDLQVTPEQVEEGCRIREKNKGDQPESNITKQAFEQLFAAEDFNAFRRLMTRKNIDLQLQSLELLVARYGVLSPALCPFDSSSDPYNRGEEDFLQVVIRYTEPEKTVFHSSLVTPCCQSPPLQSSPELKTSAQTYVNSKNSLLKSPSQNSALDDDESEELNGDGTPQGLQNDPSLNIVILKQNTPTDSFQSNFDDGSNSKGENETNECSNKKTIQNDLILSSRLPDAFTPDPDSIIVAEQKLMSSTKSNSCLFAPEITIIDSQILQQEENEHPGPIVTTPEPVVVPNVFPAVVEHSEEEQTSQPEVEVESEKVKDVQSQPNRSIVEDEVTVVEMASVVPEQHRILTAVRRAFDTNPTEGDEETFFDTTMIPVTGTEEEIQRRREYLRSQRDKLVALKKREREKQIFNFGRGDGEASHSDSSLRRPKSAKAAQIAFRSPQNIDKSTNEKSLQARRALAQRLKQELVDK